MDQYIRAQILRADLIAIDDSFTEKGLPNIEAILLLKQAFIAVANFSEFENSIRAIYPSNPELSALYKGFSKECEFAKYLRNKFAGHIKQELINKSIEWKPEIRMFLENMDDGKVMHMVNLFILETAINTYVNADGNHRIFDSETDLMYPPDNTRFLIFLTNVIRSTIKYLNMYIELTNQNMKGEIEDSGNIKKHALKAGKTAFNFIKK